MKNKKLYYLILAILLINCSQLEHTKHNLEIDFISNLRLDPVFSWKTDYDGTASSQSAWQIIVSDTPSDINKNIGKVWDSDKQKGNDVSDIQYAGKKLISGSQYYAKVRVWDENGNPSAWSEIERFMVPLEYPNDWNAEWITYDYADDTSLPLFRKSFRISDSDEIEYVRFYIAAPGFYEAYLNGEKIGENVLDPGQTNYEDYTYYVAYDIDADSLDDENVIGVMLGNGWYNQNEVWNESMIYGQPVFISQLEIHYLNGKTKTIGSDESWQWAYGPILRSNIYGGETYDARLEKTDWLEAVDKESDWNDGIQSENHPTMLYEQFQEPIRVMGEVEVKEIIDKGNGTYILDMGRNITGWTQLKIQGTEGQEIIQRFVEELDAEGNIDPVTTGVNATKVIQTSRYISKGDGLEVWEPRFVYYGFRYVEVEGLTSPPEKDMITGQVVRSSVQGAGSFSCSEDNINKLHQLSRWTIEGNIHSIPTDCPHREKCGWTGDSHALIQSMIYNYDSHKFFWKYMLDMRSSGREEKKEIYFGKDFTDRSFVMKPAGIPTMVVPGRRTCGVATADWGTALVQIPWYLHLYYGDKMILKEFYEDMRTWVSYIHGNKEDGIIMHGLGDWCPPGGNKLNKDCPVPLSSTAFHILDISIMEKVSALLGKEDHQKEYAEMKEQLIRDFNRHFLDLENATYGTQTGSIMALDIGAVPEELRYDVAASIVKSIHQDFGGFIKTGIFGIARVFNVLSKNGQEEEVYRLLTKTGNRSFAFMWDHYKATTLWEVLPVTDDYPNIYRGSHSHPMQAGFNAWFYSGIAGINPSEDIPGFGKIIFKPYLTAYLDCASASYESGYGSIESSWKRKSDVLTWKLAIPQNTTGVIQVPLYDSDAVILVNGEPAEVSGMEDGFGLLGEYTPGKYTIELTYLKDQKN